MASEPGPQAQPKGQRPAPCRPPGLKGKLRPRLAKHLSQASRERVTDPSPAGSLRPPRRVHSPRGTRSPCSRPPAGSQAGLEGASGLAPALAWVTLGQRHAEADVPVTESRRDRAGPQAGSGPSPAFCPHVHGPHASFWSFQIRVSVSAERSDGEDRAATQTVREGRHAQKGFGPTGSSALRTCRRLK